MGQLLNGEHWKLNSHDPGQKQVASHLAGSGMHSHAECVNEGLLQLTKTYL